MGGVEKKNEKKKKKNYFFISKIQNFTFLTMN